ncbi:hypothetical protein F0Q53_01890 [Anaplasma marginale]|uniref:DedA family protein n=1 Tax=Anaplasma marginale TaxID=770 RepID=A0A643CKR6_ANAMA|nr:hypothetical protein [Anaplasma marginale]KAA8474592.1 hypothetical protein F0Q53_01890 [Anaplasma marginale]KAB0451847.1 hypothetical protein FY207_03140 [Anaplasma marginale]RCL19684.1 hypothetical protein DOS86_03465 [Anaplasma marginale]
MGLSHTLEAYLLLFTDSVVGSVVLPVNRATVFDIICCFGGYDPLTSILVATLGALLGGIVNWCLGRLVMFARMRYHKSEYTQPGGYLQLACLAPLALLSWTHIVGSLINVSCGYLRVNLGYTCLAVFVSHFAYSTYHAIITKFLNLW